MPETSFADVLRRFAVSLTANFASRVPAQPEDQLKAPMVELLASAGTLFRQKVIARTETQVEGLGGRPDVGVDVAGLLTGHLELKAPGKGARPDRFKGGDAAQWRKFQALPNLIYSDGSEWSLYRTGERQGETVHFSGDVTADGEGAFTEEQAQQLRELLRDFLLWQPITPSSPRALAELLAPLCRLVRDDVMAALQNPDSNISMLAAEWRQALFPDADDAQFADAYAQTLTYALLLAKLSGQADVRPSLAADALDSGHGLLAQVLRILSQGEARDEIGLGVDLLVRVISAVDPAALRRKGQDPWLYFYEDFLAAYDPKLRLERGVIYTPIEVIRSQVRVAGRLLEEGFGKDLCFADPEVVVLDPAAGTGAYPLAVLQHGLARVADDFGEGSVSGYATDMARSIHAFEILVGPYAVSHLRLTQAVADAGGTLPQDGVHVYLTDTLEAPHAQPPKGQQTLMYRRLSDEHRRAQKVKAQTPVLVCIGNPPYNRQEIADREVGVERKGGWVRFGDGNEGGILEDFLAPAREAGYGVHLKNLYNDYVYFWRWALWKVFESTKSRGVVSLITAASYLRGPAFVGMRKVMRQTLDELWIIDLEGDSLGARKTENVFNIRVPVAIAVGVRYGGPNPDKPATVRYAKITGTQSEKLSHLDSVRSFDDLDWAECFSGWMEPFLPVGEGNYFDWPLLTDVFPWQHSGSQFKRTWPIGETRAVLEARWRALVSAPRNQRPALLKETRDRKAAGSYAPLDGAGPRLRPINTLAADAPPPPVTRYAFRSFDRQWVLADARLADYPKPVLWQSLSNRQVYITSILSDVLGAGPAATVAGQVPDLHHFSGRGGKDAIPLWRDSAAAQPNVTTALLDRLSSAYGREVKPEDLFGYCYAVLAGPGYVQRFSEELTIPGPRIPLTKAGKLFRRAADLGRHLIWLHTYGTRFAPAGQHSGRIPRGTARNTRRISADAASYPESFGYDEPTRTLHVGSGAFAPVPPEVWRFSVSGLEVVKSWLSYRMKSGAGRTSSDLDKIRPESWTSDLTRELLYLLWVLEATVSMLPGLESLLASIVAAPVFHANELPRPSPEQRRPPRTDGDDAEDEPGLL